MCIITISTYNKLVKLRSRVDNAWAQIDVQLKKRYDLIPNLVETVKGYAKHEKETLENVIMWRSRATGAATTEDAIEANKGLGQAVGRLLVACENYPELKANQNFMSLQAELKDLENKIAMTRQFYNDTVMNYNQKRELFPSNIIANIFKFKAAPYFQADEASREAPKVSFS